MHRPENNRSLATAGSDGVDEGRWALMLAEQLCKTTSYHSALQTNGV
jgi:hypothetical protein